MKINSLAQADSEPQLLVANEFYIMVCIRKSLRSKRLAAWGHIIKSIAGSISKMQSTHFKRFI